jgi:hypothetical protein
MTARSWFLGATLLAFAVGNFAGWPTMRGLAILMTLYLWAWTIDDLTATIGRHKRRRV